MTGKCVQLVSDDFVVDITQLPSGVGVSTYRGLFNLVYALREQSILIKANPAKRGKS